MELKIGKKYMTKSGLYVCIKSADDHRRFPFLGVVEKSGSVLSYNKCGMYSYNESRFDLVEITPA